MDDWLSEVEGGLDMCVRWALLLGFNVGAMIFAGVIHGSPVAFIHAFCGVWAAFALWANVRVTRRRMAS